MSRSYLPAAPTTPDTLLNTPPLLHLLRFISLISSSLSGFLYLVSSSHSSHLQSPFRICVWQWPGLSKAQPLCHRSPLYVIRLNDSHDAPGNHIELLKNVTERRLHNTGSSCIYACTCHPHILSSLALHLHDLQVAAATHFNSFTLQSLLCCIHATHDSKRHQIRTPFYSSPGATSPEVTRHPEP